MTDKELFFLLCLQRVPKIGDITAKKLLHRFGFAENIFHEKRSSLLKIDGVGKLLVNNLLRKENFRAAEKELKFIRDNTLDVCCYNEDHYPRNLRHCIDGPILLFKRGGFKLSQQHQKIISVVGTRKVTSYGNAVCNQLIEDLAPFNPVIVSGFAFGVDICAHKAAIKNGLQTIGCLAHGLNQIYPKSHAKYISEIEKKGGFITDFWSDDEPERNNFLKRNRIIAGMADATVVIESADKGGSLVTADIAISYNREVFAVPGRANDTYSIGCNNLIKSQRAHMLTSAADLVYILGWKIEEAKNNAVQKQLFVELSETESHIHTYLQKNGKKLLDVIALECKMPVHKLASLLLSMEMKGVVRPLPGKLFEAV